jgi:hypothetical protein
MSVGILALVHEPAAGLGPIVPVEEPSAEAVAKLIAQLGAAQFRTREQASTELVKLGRPILPALRKAATAHTELEVRRRIEHVVIRIEAASVEKLAKAYCRKHGLTWNDLEGWHSALAPDGRVFRYKLPAVPGQGKRRDLAGRYAFVFVDPASGNVYDVKRIPGGDRTLEQRTWAILRLMGTKVADNNHAAAVMGDLLRTGQLLDDRHAGDSLVGARVVQVTKGANWIEPATTYHADTGSGLRVVMPVDEDGYVTGFRIWNPR